MPAFPLASAPRLPPPLRRADRLLGRIVGAGRWLVFAVTLLLFLQWPLRDLLQAYSREANDLAQWLFALYVSMAVPYATRAGTHLAADSLGHRLPRALRARLDRLGALLVLLPWSLFILVTGWGMVSRSVLQLETFPDTFNPGYFIVKASAWLMALLTLLQALLDTARGRS
ncbi:TRAP transporter small permease subunit [Azospirillum sp. B510]|uniref:TRAP transporter small permease subunit n=1 Tax=Azospirillum sp. (strain B510) TaxID=137722 RepID=UPI001FFEFA3E|nr:TRAP transporter small permease subunit [Azospirillum sp. B510]